MLHFASYFLAQQLICCVHVFGCKNAPLVQGDHPSPGRGQAIAPTMDEPCRGADSPLLAW